MRNDTGALQEKAIVLEDLVLKQDLVNDLLGAAGEQVMAQLPRSS